MCSGSPPGSTTIACLVSGQPRIEQLHWKAPTGNVSRSSMRAGAIYAARGGAASRARAKNRGRAKSCATCRRVEAGSMTALVLSLLLSTTQAQAARPQARLLATHKRAGASARPRPSYPAVELFAVNLGETLRFRPYDERGRLRRGVD